jgi:hypothetical protein
LARDGDTPALDKFHLHVQCFTAWVFERSRAGETRWDLRFTATR